MPKCFCKNEYRKFIAGFFKALVKPLECKKGISFIEIVVTALLVALIVVAMGGALTQSSVFSKRIDMIYTASSLAQRHMDTLKRFGYNELPRAAERNVRINASGVIDIDGLYRRTTRVNTSFRGNPYLTRVEVRVQRAKIGLDGAILNTLDDPIIITSLFSNTG